MKTTTVAVDAVLAAILPSYGMDTDPAEVPALRRKAAIGLSHALHTLARGVSPGERFTLDTLADQIARDFTSHRKASR